MAGNRIAYSATMGSSTGSSITTWTESVYPVPSEPPKVTKREVRPVRVVAKCARPKARCKGEMEATGSGYTAGFAPTVWRHQCRTCGFEAHYTETFPRIEYEEVPRGR